MPKKILVVDDKPFMMRLIQHHLERAGYELIKARNRQEAIAALDEESPELVVVDDGASPPAKELQEINPRHAAHSIPVIRMTDVPQTLEPVAPVNDSEVVLTKPFSPTQLVAEVKRLVPEV
jgi:DNA-binding response OmpR family regulator